MKKTARGFTLVELLIVIAIIAVSAAIVVLVVNPIELTRRSRDAARLSDLANLQQAITVAVGEATESGTDILCSQGFDAATSRCRGTSTDTGARDSDGTGWVDVNFSNLGVSIPVLPADPQNTTASHYTYCSDGDAWEINANLESEQQDDKETTDGGGDDALYEVGSDLTLIDDGGAPPCTY